MLERGGYMDKLNRDTTHDTKQEAIHGVFQKLDKNICAHCDKRIFVECGEMKGPAASRAPGT